MGFMLLKETVSKWKSGSIQPKVANYGFYCFKKKKKKMEFMSKFKNTCLTSGTKYII